MASSGARVSVEVRLATEPENDVPGPLAFNFRYVASSSAFRLQAPPAERYHAQWWSTPFQLPWSCGSLIERPPAGRVKILNISMRNQRTAGGLSIC